MIKKTILALLLAALTVSGSAKQAEESAIRKVAMNFYYEHAMPATGLTLNMISIREMTPVSYNGHIVYYTIKLNPKGWIIVTADDAVTPVIAYSFEDNLDGSSLPPQFVSWMEKYKKQVDDVISRKLPASAEITTKWTKYTNFDLSQAPDQQMTQGVGPLILHTWDQGYPYNIDCPIDPAGPGNHPYAGCVATAMCQVMYYYRFPVTGNGQHCYTPGGYPVQCANYGATTYNWDGMLNSLTGARLDNDSAVALLLWHAGIAVNMMYSPGGSGAYSEDARNALVNYFRYSNSASYIQRSDYSEASWDSILRADLDKKMPIYYDGYNPSEGHAFNCDGYQGTDHFHFNWGWSGTANGYYYLNNLNPAGYNFSDGEGAIVKIFPDTLSNTYPYTCAGQKILSSVAGTFDDGSGPALGYRNNSNCSWLIEPQSAEDSVQSINITFNYFSTQPGSGIVRIYKGSSTSDSLAGEFSGDALPPLVTINGTKALVTFTTASSGQGQGWLITYTGKVMEWCNNIQTITDSTGTISDGSFHFNYHNYTGCRWKILPAGNKPLNLVFTSFRTEKDHDFVSVYDYGTGVLLAEYSGVYTPGDMPSPVTANSGQMFILFTSNQTVTDAGWEARYSTLVGTPEIQNNAGFLVYPNPARGNLYIRTLKNGNGSLQVLVSDMKGMIVLSKVFLPEQDGIKLDISGLSSGLYFVKIVSEKESEVRKIVIE